METIKTRKLCADRKTLELTDEELMRTVFIAYPPYPKIYPSEHLITCGEKACMKEGVKKKGKAFRLQHQDLNELRFHDLQHDLKREKEWNRIVREWCIEPVGNRHACGLQDYEVVPSKGDEMVVCLLKENRMRQNNKKKRKKNTIV